MGLITGVRNYIAYHTCMYTAVKAGVPTDLLCNGPTTSAEQSESGRGSMDCMSVLEEGSESDKITLDEMDCTTKQNSNLKSTQNSEKRFTTPHIPSEIDDIDPAKLFSLFERVVEETEDCACSVEMMEKMLEHLVFRYRLRSDRRQLNSEL